MQSGVIGHVLNYRTGKELPVVMAKVVRLDVSDDQTKIFVWFETSSSYTNGAFRYDMAVLDALKPGSRVPVAITFAFSSNREMVKPDGPTPLVAMVGLSAHALDDEDGSMIYALEDALER